jgi:hypothetical protein
MAILCWAAKNSLRGTLLMGSAAFYFRALLTAYLLSLTRTDIIKSDVLVVSYQRMQLC